MTIIKTVRPPEKSNAKDYAISVGRIMIILIALSVAFNYVKNHTGISNNLKRVNTEIWITVGGGLLSAWWKFNSENERAKIALAQTRASANSEAIRALDSRIDSALLQIQDLRMMQIDDTTSIEQLTNAIHALKTEQMQGRHQLLIERMDLIQKFYNEICSIHSHISFNKGVAAGMKEALQETQTKAQDVELDIQKATMSALNEERF
jgi:chromosome segregation ATPase